VAGFMDSFSGMDDVLEAGWNVLHDATPPGW
jgi:hypothetical protein